MVTTQSHLKDQKPYPPDKQKWASGLPERAIFSGIGWKIRLQQKRTNYFFTLAKELVVGNALRKGNELFYYLVDCEGRKAMLVFLDGEERPVREKVHLDNSRFLISRT